MLNEGGCCGKDEGGKPWECAKGGGGGGNCDKGGGGKLPGSPEYGAWTEPKDAVP